MTTSESTQLSERIAESTDCNSLVFHLNINISNEFIVMAAQSSPAAFSQQSVTVSNKNAVSKTDHLRILFQSSDLDLDLMTLTYKLDLNILDVPAGPD